MLPPSLGQPQSRPLWGRKLTLRCRHYFFGSLLHWGTWCLFLGCCGGVRVTICPDSMLWSSPIPASLLCGLQLCPEHKINIIHREAARKQLAWKHVFQLTQSFVWKTVWFRFLSQVSSNCPWSSCKVQVKAKGLKSSKTLPCYMHNIYFKNNIKPGKKAVSGCPGFGCTCAIHDFCSSGVVCAFSYFVHSTCRLCCISHGGSYWWAAGWWRMVGFGIHVKG